MPGVSRRVVVGVVGAGVVVTPLAGAAALAHASTQDKNEPPPEIARERARALLQPLGPGSRLARWSVVAIHPLERGAVTIDVSGDDGHVFRLEVLARDPSPMAPRGPGLTERFSVHVKNGGDGWLPTVEEQGLAAMTLASVISANEAHATLDGFLTYAERIDRHRESLLPADGVYSESAAQTSCE
jgi:hypothetical protein